MTLMAINWGALLMVAAVTVVASSLIAGLMSLSNWFLTPVGEAVKPTRPRAIIGYALIVVIGLIVLYGLYLMIPYFHLEG